MEIIGYWVWFLSLMAILFIPLYLSKKGKEVTRREVFFLAVGIWVGGGYYFIQAIIN